MVKPEHITHCLFCGDSDAKLICIDGERAQYRCKNGHEYAHLVTEADRQQEVCQKAELEQTERKREECERAMVQRRIASVFSAVGFFIALLFMGAGVLVLGYQVVLWLREGQWQPCPLGALVLRILPVDFWNELCGSWVGLRKIVFAVLEGVPLSLALVIAGGLALAADTSR